MNYFFCLISPEPARVGRSCITTDRNCCFVLSSALIVGLVLLLKWLSGATALSQVRLLLRLS